MKATLTLIQSAMDGMDCTTDSPMIFVNGYNRVCAKVHTRNKGTIAGWGDEVQDALQNLLKEIVSKRQESVA
jgi:hypothetical protein